MSEQIDLDGINHRWVTLRSLDSWDYSTLQSAFADACQSIDTLVRHAKKQKDALAAATARAEALRRVIDRHYPTIAGCVLRYQEAHEDRAAEEWGHVARDFYEALHPAAPLPAVLGAGEGEG